MADHATGEEKNF